MAQAEKKFGYLLGHSLGGAEGSPIWADGLVHALFTQVSFPESRSLSAW